MRTMVTACHFFVESSLETIIFNDGVFSSRSPKTQKESFLLADSIFRSSIDAGASSTPLSPSVHPSATKPVRKPTWINLSTPLQQLAKCSEVHQDLDSTTRTPSLNRSWMSYHEHSSLFLHQVLWSET